MFMAQRKIFLIAVFVLSFLFFVAPLSQAAITEDGIAQDGFFENNTAVGGGAILPLLKFRLNQASGSDTLSQVGVQIIASSTMAAGEISRLSLWMESKSQPGFQFGSDTFLAGAASSSPSVNGVLNLLTPTSAVSIGYTGEDFYIVASTSAVTGITNGHAFNVLLQ